MYWGEEKFIPHLAGKTVGKRPPGRPRHRWEDNIRKSLEEIAWEEGMDWIGLAHDRDRWRSLVNTAMNLHVS
jgi:hypothetical protein